MKALIITSLLIAAFLLGCNNKHYTPDQLPGEHLSFGDGGGFTGAVTEYILLENGQLYRFNSMEKDTVEIGKLKKKETKSLLMEVKALNLDKINIQEPGNMYYFISMKNGDKIYKITWGSATYTIDPKIEAFYKKLMNTVKKSDKPTM